MKKHNIIIYSLLINLTYSISVFAQAGTQGQISGFARDQAGAAVASASVIIKHEDTGYKRQTKTDDKGYYIVSNIPPGIYEIVVEHPGFKKLVKPKVKLNIADKQSVNLDLEVGSLNETIIITSSPANVEDNTAQVGRLIEERQVLDLSLNGRNPVFLQMLKAGVLGFNPNGFNFRPSTGVVNVNGSRHDENSILLDGVQQVRTRSAGETTGVITVDTVQEIRILTSNYAPEFGRANGGQTLFVTKSGTQNFHGSVWHFLRNSALDANSWGRNRTPITPFNRVAEKPPALRFNQPGYALSGPFVIPKQFNANRQSLFFFWSQEWTRFRNETTVTATVPSIAIRQGDVRELGASVKDPLTGLPFFDPAQGVGFIPENRLSKVGLALVSAYPLPNCEKCFPGQTTNYINTGGNAEDTRKDVLRVDYYEGRHHISFRGSNFEWKIRNAFRGAFDFTPDNHSRPNRSAGITITTAISPKLVNEFTFGSSVDVVELSVRGRSSRRALGIIYPYIFPGTKELDDKVPTVSITNYTDIDGGPYPARSSGIIYTWADTLTLSRASHTFKLGFNVEYSGENDLDQINIQQVPGSTNNQNGRFEFRPDRPGGTGIAIADALLGLFRSYGEIGQKNYTPWRATTFEWFIQDNWKMKPNFTLEYGVRYNYWPPWHSLWNNIATFNPLFYERGLLTLDSMGAVVVGPGIDFVRARFNGIALPGEGFPLSAHGRVAVANDSQFNSLFRGIPEGLSETHKNVIEPRLGIAYALNKETVIRTGFGIFHNRVLLNDSSLLGGNAPLQFLVGVENGIADAPAGVVRSFTDSIRFPFILTAQDPAFKHPTAYSWSLTLQRNLPSNILVELAYIGKRSIHLPRERNINQLQPGQNFLRDDKGKVIGIVPISNALRPFLGHSQIRLAENAANAIYHSFQVSVNRRFNNGFSFDIAYTLSKSIDNASDKRTILPNAYDDRRFRAASDFDLPHMFVVNYIYELPFGRGKRFMHTRGLFDILLGGWQITGISFLRSGTPFSIFSPVDALGVGPGSGQQFASIRTSVRQVDRPKLDGNYFTDPTVFTLPEPGIEGNLGRNVFRNPGFQNHDLAIVKNIQISEGKRLQFRAEMFNFVNHPNLNGPDTNLSANGIITNFTDPNYGSFRSLTNDEIAAKVALTRNFGVITGKSPDRRQIQIALKLTF